MPRSQQRIYPNSATSRDFLTMARDEVILRLGHGPYSLMDMLVVADGKLLYIHSLQHKDPELSSVWAEIIHDKTAMLREVDGHLKSWGNILPEWLALKPFIMVTRDAGPFAFHECLPNDPEFLMGITGALNHACSVKVPDEEQDFLAKMIVRVTEYLILEVVTFPGQVMVG